MLTSPGGLGFGRAKGGFGVRTRNGGLGGRRGVVVLVMAAADTAGDRGIKWDPVPHTCRHAGLALTVTLGTALCSTPGSVLSAYVFAQFCLHSGPEE